MTTRIQIGDRVKPSKSSTKTMIVTNIEQAPYLTKQPTFVEGVDDQGRKIRRPLNSVIKVG